LYSEHGIVPMYVRVSGARACASEALARAEYDSMSRLDTWKTKLLLRAKKKIVQAVAEEEEDLT